MRDPRPDQHRAARGALGEPDLRVFDCTTYLEPPPPGSEEPYIAVPGRETFEEAHIPGADFLDLQGEFSDNDHAAALHDAGDGAARGRVRPPRVGAGTRVVLYSIGTMMWATRFWWMLRSLGFDGAAVLDGGFDKWRPRAGRSRAARPRAIRPRPSRPCRAPGLFVDKGDVLAAIGEPGTVIVNALGPQFHAGLEPSRYGRPGRVPGSVNVSAATLVDPATKGFTPLADAAAKFAAQGVTQGQEGDRLLRRRHLGHASTCSCCTSSATTSSRSTTARWASGRRTRRCRSRRDAEAMAPVRYIDSITQRYASLGYAPYRWYVADDPAAVCSR